VCRCRRRTADHEATSDDRPRVQLGRVITVFTINVRYRSLSVSTDSCGSERHDPRRRTRRISGHPTSNIGGKPAIDTDALLFTTRPIERACDAVVSRRPSTLRT
jgi:hypothetical protein